MKSGSWIKLHRDILKWEWYHNTNVMRLFIHLLLRANHVKNNFQGIIIERGELMTSIEHLSDETGLSFQQTRTSLKNLKSTGEITIKSTSKYSIIQVVKYDNYQSLTNNVTNKQQTTNKQTNKRLTTNKNDKEIKKNEKKVLPNGFSEDFLNMPGAFKPLPKNMQL